MHASTSGSRRLPPVRELGLLAMLVAGILILGGWLVLGPEQRLAFLLYDDAYYYLGVARHLAAGAGSTFDGLNQSNGYHPLWCALLVPIFWLTRDPGMALRLATAVWFLLAAGTAIAIWWWLRVRSGATAALVAAALFSAHPHLALRLARPNGLETPLYALLLVLFLAVFERTLSRDRPVPSSRVVFAGGLLLGAVILARLDGGMFSLAAAGLLLVAGYRERRVPEAVLRTVKLAAGASLLVLPVLAWNTMQFGSPMPLSERAVQVYAAEVRQELGGPLAASFWERRAWHGLAGIPVGMGRAATGNAGLFRPIWRAGVVAGIGVLTVLLLATLLAIRRRAPGRGEGDGLTLLAAGCLVHYGAYVGWFWAGAEKGFRYYYFMPECLLAACVLGHLAGRLPARLARSATASGILAGVAVVIMLAFAGGTAVRKLPATRSGPRPMAESHIYGWIRNNLPEDAVLATTDAGLLGFFCGRPVVNLDGLINDQVFLEALRRRQRAAYVHASPITHLVAGIGALRGWDPEQPEIPPEEYDPMGSILYELSIIPGCRLRQAARVDNWLIFEIIRQ